MQCAKAAELYKTALKFGTIASSDENVIKTKKITFLRRKMFPRKEKIIR